MDWIRVNLCVTILNSAAIIKEVYSILPYSAEGEDHEIVEDI